MSETHKSHWSRWFLISRWQFTLQSLCDKCQCEMHWARPTCQALLPKRDTPPVPCSLLSGHVLELPFSSPYSKFCENTWTRKSQHIQGCPQCSMTKSPDTFGVVLDAPHSALTSLVLSIIAPDSCGLDLTSFQGCSFSANLQGSEVHWEPVWASP
jgi:hypothetical protein